MIKNVDGKAPRIAPSVLISEMAYISGDVEIGEGSDVCPCAVIRAESNPVRIGKRTCIEDGSVLHAGYGPMDVGDDVIIGHGAVIHCRRIGNGVLVGMNATILPGAEIGDGCIIAAGSVVGEGLRVPPNSLVAGVPGRIRRQVKPTENMERARTLHTYLACVRKMAREGGF